MIICADDYGMAPDIDTAALELAQAGKVTAVSVMAALPRVNRGVLEPLMALGEKIDVGLHLVLTDSRSLASGQPQPSFQGLMKLSWLGRYSPDAAEKEIAAQYSAFTAMAGRPPDFIDGHMHVHQFPIIREALIRFINQIPGRKPYTRNTHLPFLQIAAMGISPLKAWSISLPGGKMKRLLDAAQIPTNTGFTGVYDFASCHRYPDYLARFTGQPLSPSAILMFHPGKVDLWRRMEYEAFSRADNLGAPTRFPRSAGEAP